MSKQISISRARALTSCESRIQSVLFSVAKQILLASKKYRRRPGRLSGESRFLADAKAISARAADDIESAVSRYSLASAKLLGVDGSRVESFLSSKVHGKTSRQRTTAYLANFAEDIFRMTKAAALMGYTDSQLLSAVRTGYKSPYVTSVITKARRHDINIATPSYGRGVLHSAYRNLTRNARQMVALAWGMAEQQYGRDHGAVAYRSYRGSSFPCPVCDDETTYIHHFGDPYPPYHINCVCYVKFIYPNDDDPANGPQNHDQGEAL